MVANLFMITIMIVVLVAIIYIVFHGIQRII